MSVMDTKIQKWGNSLAVRIPKVYVDQLGLYSNSPIKISVEGAPDINDNFYNIYHVYSLDRISENLHKHVCIRIDLHMTCAL
jgi:antitoxin component of MazEF toxin-antitoxin module